MTIDQEMYDKMPENLRKLFIKLPNYGSQEVLDLFPESKSSLTSGMATPRKIGTSTDIHGIRSTVAHGDSGSAARFFYCAKASKADRAVGFSEEVKIEWISEKGPNQVVLQVDTAPSQKKDIVVLGSMEKQEWNMFLSGSNIMDLFQTASKCIIKMKTNSTMTSLTWNYLMHLLTKESTVDVSYETESGGNHAESVEKFNQSLIIILGKTVSLPGVNHVALGTPLKISVREKTQSLHPTIKPIKLIRWLVRLITPQGGTTLDPFAGSGTTGQAAYLEGFKAILVERETEYQGDIRNRLKNLDNGSCHKEIIKEHGSVNFDHASRESIKKAVNRATLTI